MQLQAVRILQILYNYYLESIIYYYLLITILFF